MNKISLYIFLIIIYLGLSRTFAPQIQSQIYIQNEKSFPNFFKQEPMTLILIDSFKTGFIIKSYFQKYLKLYAFGPTQEVLVKTSKDFWKEHFPHRGLSIFRRYDTDNSVNFTPLPPGMVFINNPSFGAWVRSTTGKQFWRFHRAYRSFPKVLGWDTFVLTREFYQEVIKSEKQGKTFLGFNNEFGEHGTITQKSFPQSNLDKREKINFIEHVREIFLLEGMKSNE